ncbi:hypothetical protein CH063_08443 [Colletotrichum higginsianum]|uniref:Uncharacterized protein n=1 Tax=Colletotrichum higginsianum (strain IMI 349063) TaxID=759273 RepID=H1V9V8_COLHI|nr:hypothetical protein CH063_08443 [Colletotrichum higginsianum]
MKVLFLRSCASSQSTASYLTALVGGGRRPHSPIPSSVSGCTLTSPLSRHARHFSTAISSRNTEFDSRWCGCYVYKKVQVWQAKVKVSMQKRYS